MDSFRFLFWIQHGFWSSPLLLRLSRIIMNYSRYVDRGGPLRHNPYFVDIWHIRYMYFCAYAFWLYSYKYIYIYIQLNLHRFEKASASVYKVRCDKHDKHAMSELCHTGEVLQQVTSGEINPSPCFPTICQDSSRLLDVVYIMYIKHTCMWVNYVTLHDIAPKGRVWSGNERLCS